MIFIGMDNGRVSHRIVVVNERQEVVKKGTIPNESWAFTAWCEHIEKAFPGEEIVVGIEEGGGMSTPFDEIMQSRGWSVRQVPPEAVRSYRETVLRIHDKTDDTDGFTIAIMLATRKDAFREVNQERAALRRATRWRENLVAQKIELINELRATLAEYWPETAGSKVFSELSRDCRWAWLLLEHFPDPAVIVAKGAKRLHQFFVKHKSTILLEKVEAIVKLAASNTAFAADKPFLVRQTAQQARLLRQVDEFKVDTEKAIAELSRYDIDVKSVDARNGVSVVQAAGYMAELRAIVRFEKESNMASYSGLVTKRIQTGKSMDKRRPQVRANRRLRKILLGMAWSMSMNDERSKAYYNKKIGEGKTHDHALTCLARHLSRGFYRILKRNHQQQLNEARPAVTAQG